MPNIDRDNKHKITENSRCLKKETINRNAISKYAIDVAKRLGDAGYQVLLVGGSVRDLLLNEKPKDFDIATNAHPEQIKALFKNSYIIGRRFRLVHIRYPNEIIEVSTFRKEHPDDCHTNNQDSAALSNKGMIIRDNIYGTLKTDVIRRDLTINAIYYDIKKEVFHDHVGGIDDLHNGIIRLIGPVDERYREDPIRILRAIRFAAKHNFKLDKNTADPIKKLSHLIKEAPPARVYEEILKLFLTGKAESSFILLQKHELFGLLFPLTSSLLEAPKTDNYDIQHFLQQLFKNTDKRIQENKPVTPAFLFAALLWYPLYECFIKIEKESNCHIMVALNEAIEYILKEQLKHILIPRRFTHVMQSIWELQLRLHIRHGRRAQRLFENRRFRASYDLVLLREDAGEKLHDLGQWWTNYQEYSLKQRKKMIENLTPLLYSQLTSLNDS